MKNVPEKLLKPYDPTVTEPVIQKLEQASGYYNPDKCIADGVTKPDAPSYTIILPPPNVTGILHMGHALGTTMQDILIRFHRMSGYKTLWVPGTDHAAIATQSRVEKDIQKEEGKNRHDLGREELLKRVNAFALQSQETIISQLKALGASLDWSREAFTLDEQRNFAVRTVFKKMYDDGLIIKKNRVINWDPKGQTTIADDEIVYEDRKAKLYTFKYSADFPIAISTTRPETKLGDTAVAVHPEDERYKHLIGKEFSPVFCGVQLNIKIVADISADKEFGTGAVGITPAHSMIDYEVAERHGLPMVQVIDEKARIMVGGPELFGKKVTEAREIVVEWLRQNNLLISEEEVDQRVSTAERTGGIVEPLPKLQWFVAVNKPFKFAPSGISEIKGLEAGQMVTLKDIMRHTVSSGQVEIVPDFFNKTYFHWIDSLRDWCISRQIWYGHRIPVWYKKDVEGNEIEMYCDMEAPVLSPEDAEKGYIWAQDEDTLDTWFSSSLWSFSTLGWPKSADPISGLANAGSDLSVYHPTSILVTAYEILYFWVARMILMTGYALGTVPFKQVLLTGVVRDTKGRKFSKSLGNGIDPIDVANKFGIDAGRVALIAGTAPGTDSKIDENKIKGYKHFANKLWNITRFVVTNVSDEHLVSIKSSIDSKDSYERLNMNDKKLTEERNSIFNAITENIKGLKMHLAFEELYDYVWKSFADIILEDSKKVYSEVPGADGSSATAEDKLSRSIFLIETLTDSLKMLHPFMPHVTQEIWSLLPKEIKNKELLLIEKWPLF